MSPVQSGKRIKTTLNYIGRLAITGLLLFLTFRSVDLAQVQEALREIAVLPLLLALGCLLASNFIASFRWFLIMRKIGFSFGYPFLLASFFKGAFFNQGLPTAIGGDAIRVLDCGREKGTMADAFYGVFIDRIIGMAGLLFLNIGALLINRTLLPAGIYSSLMTIMVLLSLILLALFFVHRIRFLSRIRLLRFISDLSHRYAEVYATPVAILVQTGLSVVNHLMAMVSIFLLGRSVGLDYPISVYLVLVPPVILLTILPISLAGWGVREGAMIGFFLLVGADQTRVLTVSLLFGLLVIITSLPGLFVFLFQKKQSGPTPDILASNGAETP